MTVRARRLALRLALVSLLGIVAGMAGYLAWQRLSAPGPRPAPGWSLLAELPDPRGETAAAVANGRIYVAGGYRGLEFETTALVWAYDVATDAWTAAPELPEPRNHAAAATLDGTVYLSGGSAGSGAATDTLWALRPGASAWTVLAAMPGARSAHRLLASDGRLYAVGGVGGATEGPGAAGRVLVYDVASDAWSEGAPMPVNRDHLGAVVVGGAIWAIGGRVGGANHALVDVYDPATDTWRPGPALPEATSGAAEAVVDGVLYVSGGEDPGSATIVDRHWQLDTTAATPAWAPMRPPPLAVHGVPGVAFDGRFLVIAGSSRPGGQSNTAWTGATQAYDPRAASVE